MHWDALKWSFEADLPASLNSGAHAVLVALAYSMHPATKKCNPSIERLCKLTLLKPTAIKTALRKLKKEKIIFVYSGKQICKSNTYQINFNIIPKKPQKDEASNVKRVNPTSGGGESTKNDYLVAKNSAESDYLTGRNTATNIQSNNKQENKVVVSSSSSSNIMDDDSPIRKDSSDSIYNERLQRVNPRTNRGPCGERYARSVVQAYFNSKSWYQNNKDKWVAGMAAIAKFIQFLPSPTIEDVDEVIDAIHDQNDWDILEETTELLQEQLDNCRDVRNWKSYAMSALKRNFDESSID